MRILIAHAHRTVIGGVEKYLETVIPALRAAGHELGFLYEHPSDAPALCGDIASWRQVRDALAWAPDVIYAHDLSSPALERELIGRCPAALFVHDYQRTCPTGRKCHTRPSITPCTRRAGPACLLLHYPRRCGGLSPLTAIGAYRRQQQRLDVASRYPAVLVASRRMQQELAVHGIAEQRLHMLAYPSGIQPDPALPGTRIPSGRILMLSRLVDVKGGTWLVRALPLASRQLSMPLRLTVAGSGPDRAPMAELAAALGVDIEFAGWVDEAARLRLMRDADLLAVPSLWPEPYGLVGMEAAGVGLPAVAFAVGGIGDWLIPGENGEMAPGNPPAVEGLAAAIVRALSSVDHYNALRQGAWRRSLSSTVESHVSRLDALLRSIRT